MHTAGLVVGVLALVLVLRLGSLLDLPAESAVVSAGLVLAALLSLVGLKPGSRWQIPRKAGAFGPVVFAGVFGTILGLSVLTRIPSAVFWGLCLWASVHASLYLSLGALLTYALFRALPFARFTIGRARPHARMNAVHAAVDGRHRVAHALEIGLAVALAAAIAV